MLSIWTNLDWDKSKKLLFGKELNLYQLKEYSTHPNLQGLYMSNVAKMIISVFERVENILGKGENAGYQYILLFLQCFQSPFSSEPLKLS